MKKQKEQTATDKLYEHCSPEIKRLNAQARREKRAADRREFKAKYRP
jgi:hypothetical protein